MDTTIVDEFTDEGEELPDIPEPPPRSSARRAAMDTLGHPTFPAGG